MEENHANWMSGRLSTFYELCIALHRCMVLTYSCQTWNISDLSFSVNVNFTVPQSSISHAHGQIFGTPKMHIISNTTVTIILNDDEIVYYHIAASGWIITGNRIQYMIHEIQ